MVDKVLKFRQPGVQGSTGSQLAGSDAWICCKQFRDIYTISWNFVLLPVSLIMKLHIEVELGPDEIGLATELLNTLRCVNRIAVARSQRQ